MGLVQLTPGQLRKAAVIKERINDLTEQLQSLLGAAAPAASSGAKPHWTQTPEGKARLAKALRRSWRRRGARQTGTARPAASGNGSHVHWTQTPEGKAKMAKLMRARWQKRKQGAA